MNTSNVLPIKKQKMRMAQDFWPKSAMARSTATPCSATLRGRWQTYSTKTAAAKIKTGHYWSKPASTQN
jgi:hypothetical protein